MSGPAPSTRSIRHAIGVLERLPAEALAEVTERLIERLDAAGPDIDLEEETDACPAEEDGGYTPTADHGAGDSDDAEWNGDEHEPDDDDMGVEDDGPHRPSRIRTERPAIVRRPGGSMGWPAWVSEHGI